MAELEKKTARQLIDDVASLIDIQLTDNTTPSREQVVEWLNQGVIEVFRLIPPEELRDAMITHQDYTTQVFASSFEKKLIKIVSLKRNGIPCVKVEENEFGLLRTMYPYRFTADNPAYSRTTLDGEIIYKVHPSGKVVWQITYLPYPFVYETGDNEEEDAAPDRYAVPSMLESFVIQYAATYARVQDEEPGQFQLYMADWRQRLQMAYGVPVDTTEG